MNGLGNGRGKRVFRLFFACNLVLLALCLIQPIRSGFFRLIIVSSLSACLIGVCFLPDRRSLRIALLGGVMTLVLGVAFLPGRTGDHPSRDAYVRALRSYISVPYVWGGENARGVDCSGIVRAAWIDAQLRLGCRTADLRLIRSAIATWWFDASAKELAAGYLGRTRVLHSAPSIRANGDAELLPGDFAVVARGVHALAYLGDGQWIEADPGLQKVVVLQTDGANQWLDSSAVFVRWRQFD